MTILITLLTLLSLSLNTTHPDQYSVQVEINSVRSNNGDVVITLYNTAEDFPKIEEKNKYKTVRIKLEGQAIDHTFHNIPEGEYAIGIYHDENANKEFDTNFIGYPVEGFGFSQNFKPRFSAPKFNDAMFILIEDVAFNIAMLYY